jgi:hypothetical protein
VLPLQEFFLFSQGWRYLFAFKKLQIR